jgi:glycerol-3-phosphate dehydrogenase
MSEAAVIGGGVVGCAVLHALARRGVQAVLLEAEQELALGASGANSGILHTGFDSQPGTLETRLILRSNALRAELDAELGVEVWRCGALLTPHNEDGRAAVARLAENARANGVEAQLDGDGALSVPGEAVTDPVAYVRALAAAAQAGGARVLLGARVSAIARDPDGGLVLECDGREPLRAGAVVNCAGLFADEIARLAGEDPVSVYPRKGEFLVLSPPSSKPLARILLPVPSALGKGVLVFPTLDRMLIAGPTAREREDKRDWSVEDDARELILARAVSMYPPLALAEEVAAYAGLRPAGRGANYVIEPSRALPGLVHAAAIRSTGLSAALAIGEHIVELLARDGAVRPRAPRPLPAPPRSPACEPWWRRAARRSERAQEPRP